MTDSLAGTVTVAIGLGVIFVVVFSLAFKPVTALSDEQLISKSKQVRDVQHFLAKYPDATVDVHRDSNKVTVAYSISKQLSEPTSAYPDGIIRKRILAVDYRDSVGDNVFGMHLHCAGTPDPLATPAYSRTEGDMIGRIDNEGCFGSR